MDDFEKCRKCSEFFEWKKHRRIFVKEDEYLSALGGGVQGFRQYRDFTTVVCPYCGAEFRSNRVKFFGVLGPKAMSVILVIVISLFLVFIGF